MTARPTMIAAALCENAANSEPAEEDGEAGLQRALAAVPVADGAGGQQQAGEHEPVGIDHPLLRGDRGVELAGQRGQGDVECRVADDDDHQAGAQHRQDLPPTFEHGRVDVDLCHVGAWLLSSTHRDLPCPERYATVSAHFGDVQPHSHGLTCVTPHADVAKDATIT